MQSYGRSTSTWGFLLTENQLGDVKIPLGHLWSVANWSFGLKIALALKLKNFSFRIACTTLIGMRKGLDTFVKVKIDTNWVKLKAHCVL